MEMSQVVTQLKNVVKRREQGGVTFELHVPEFELHSGELVAIVGDSGCGKSTLLDMLALVSRPTQSEAFQYFAEHDIKQLWQQNQEKQLSHIRRQYLGYVLQTGGLLPFLTVFQNIQLPAKLNGLQNDEHITELATRFGIEKTLTKKPQYLSGGQRQRVAILRALQHHPKVILADEPTAAVDKKNAYKIVEKFLELAKENDTTIVMVTHDRALVSQFENVIYYTFDLEAQSENFTKSTCRLGSA